MFKPVSPQVDFVAIEKALLQYWDKEKIVKKYLQRNTTADKQFSFLDGPITANNPMGVHHAWGRTYKDLWQRFFNMKGFAQRFQNGFDCQGLWVEVEVEKDLGIRNKQDIENLIPGKKEESIAHFVQLCKNRVLKFSAIQSSQSKRLGYFMDWDHSYFTMSDENNYMIWHFLKTCHKRGWIYKGEDSVPWCPRCETAISQHEMLTEDYKELTHETVFFKLPITTKNWENISLLVWTTTPWTIPANVAVGVNVKFTYAVYQNTKTNERVIIMQKDENGQASSRLLQGKEDVIGVFVFTGTEGDWNKVKEIPSKDLIGLKYQGPFDRLSIVVKAQKVNPSTFHTVVDGSEIVTASEGTGLLHIAPGAGKEDFDLGKKEHLPVISVIGDDASYLPGMDEFSGKNAKKHPELIIDYLKDSENGRFLLKTLRFTHRYPACWRCKTELVWKVAQEWYIAMDKRPLETQDKTLREQMVDVAEKIKWIPEFGLDRELDWLKNMHDWLISKKNRYWGLALPIYECDKCGWFDVIGDKDELKKRALAGWDTFDGHSPHKPYIDTVKIKCEKCKATVSRIDDVGNPWLDAGIVGFSTITRDNQGKPLYITDRKEWQKWFPADFITESFPGQFKNWFYAMIAMSTVLSNSPQYKTVLGFATLLGEDGRPMHKSWGNAIEFNDGADKIGVDVMRWMFTKQDPQQNILFGYKKADDTRRHFHLLLWNVYNFFVTYANVDGWSTEIRNPKSEIRKNVLDSWIISKLHRLIKFVTSELESYRAHTASVAIEEFVTDLSQWYVRRSRDRVGPSAMDKSDKQNFYDTIYFVLTELCKLLAPVVPFISEEIYRNLTNDISVHLSNWPVFDKQFINKNLEDEMKIAREITAAGHALRKSMGTNVRKPLLNLDIVTQQTGIKVTGDIWAIVLAELNVKNLSLSGKRIFPKKAVHVKPQLLKEEGEAREIIRDIQILRKKAGCRLDEIILVELPGWPESFTEYICRETLAKSISKGSQLKIVRL